MGRRRIVRPGVLVGLMLLPLAMACGKQTREAARRVTVASDTAPPVDSHAGATNDSTDCTPSSGVLCLQDTAYVDKTQQVAGSIEAWATMLWFGRSGDSLVLIGNGDAVVQTSIGDQRDQLHNNMAFFDGRVPKNGTITISTSLDEDRGDSVAFALEVQDIPGPLASPALEATGRTARLIIPPPHTRRFVEFSVIPLSQVRPGIDRTAWKTVSGSHMVALTRDSLYELCRLPCVRADTIALRPNQSVTWKYRT